MAGLVSFADSGWFFIPESTRKSKPAERHQDGQRFLHDTNFLTFLDSGLVLDLMKDRMTDG